MYLNFDVKRFEVEVTPFLKIQKNNNIGKYNVNKNHVYSPNFRFQFRLWAVNTHRKLIADRFGFAPGCKSARDEIRAANGVKGKRKALQFIFSGFEKNKFFFYIFLLYLSEGKSKLAHERRITSVRRQATSKRHYATSVLLSEVYC